MKIVLTTGIFPPDIGGPASYIPRIGAALVDRGHEVEVVTLADAEAIAAPRAFPFPVHRVPRAMPRAARMIRTVRTIKALARSSDVMLANGLHLESALAARLARRPAVVKVVGDTIWERARHAGRTETLDQFQVAALPRQWRAMRALQNRYIAAFDRVLTPSAYLGRIVHGWGVPQSRIDVIYNAVPDPLPGAAAPTVDIVSVGRLVPWKGFADLIAIAAEHGWSLDIVGDGPLRADLEAQARAAGGQVRFRGHLPQADVAGAIRAGRVFVLNSSYEGLPHIVLEAMGAGVPVVASGAGGTPETIRDGETGLLVPVGDNGALAAALERMLGDAALRAEMAARAAALLAEQFSFARMVADTEALLERVAARRRA